MQEGLEISAEEVKRRLDAGEDLLLLDVREPYEWRAARLDGARLVPMGDVPTQLQQLDPERPTVVYCHQGVRSLSVTQYLRQQDFAEVRSMAGGIEAWSQRIDPAVPHYDRKALERESKRNP